MAEAIKTFFSPGLVRRLATDVARVHPEFPTRAFVAQACAGLDELALLNRAGRSRPHWRPTFHPRTRMPSRC